MHGLNRFIARLLPFVPKPIVGMFVRPYIAGESLEDAIKTLVAAAKKYDNFVRIDIDCVFIFPMGRIGLPMPSAG
jgi:hypothetical protein